MEVIKRFTQKLQDGRMTEQIDENVEKNENIHRERQTDGNRMRRRASKGELC